MKDFVVSVRLLAKTRFAWSIAALAVISLYSAVTSLVDHNILHGIWMALLTFVNFSIAVAVSKTLERRAIIASLVVSFVIVCLGILSVVASNTMWLYVPAALVAIPASLDAIRRLQRMRSKKSVPKKS